MRGLASPHPIPGGCPYCQSSIHVPHGNATSTSICSADGVLTMVGFSGNDLAKVDRYAASFAESVMKSGLSRRCLGGDVCAGDDQSMLW